MAINPIALLAAGASLGAAAGQATTAANVQRDLASKYNDENLVFPNDLIRSDPEEIIPYMTFRFGVYEKRSIYARTRLEQSGGGSIRLPIPKNIQDNFSVSYTQENLGGVSGSIVEGIASGNIGRGLANAGTAAGLELARTTAGASLQNLGIAAQVAASQGRAVLNATEAVLGVTPNAFQTVLFKNPNFKKHQFNWTLAPRSKDESLTLKKITNVFQYHMLPGLSQNATLFFSYPSVVNIFINPSNKFFYEFKTCVVENFSVNYAPSSTPSFFRGTYAPGAISISMTLQEIEMWTKRDFLNS
jgi:hypothetical protein